MLDFESVIRSFECCKQVIAVSEDCNCKDCPQFDHRDSINCVRATMDSVFKILKSLESRVIPVDELIDNKDKPTVIWIEDRTVDSVLPAIIEYTSDWFVDVVQNSRGLTSYYPDSYELTWRAWTSEPTDIQRKSTEWKS